MTAYSEQPIASGRDADVFAIDAHRVLRRYRDGSEVAAEAAVMAYVTRHGFPAPEVHHADGPDLVLERLPGTTLLRAIADGAVGIPEAAAVLADLHRRLHAVPPRNGAAPGARVVHLDLHPDNVILSPRGPVLIDWRNATDGHPDLDVAMSALIFAQVAVDPADDRAGAAGVLLEAFLRQTAGAPVRMLDRAVRIRRTDPKLTADEVRRLDAAAGLVRTAG